MLDIKQVNINFESFDKIIIGHALIDTFKVGKVSLIKQGGSIKLADIIVYKSVTANSFIGKLKQLFQSNQMNFRNNGIGTKLITATIMHSRNLGFKEIFGVMEGDIERLQNWYLSIGFNVDMESKLIRMKLAEAQKDAVVKA